MAHSNSDLLKPALKASKRSSNVNSIPIGGEFGGASHHNIFLAPNSLLQKVNYIKQTRASQFLYLKNNKITDPMTQIELSSGKFERLPNINRKRKKFDYNKATEGLSPIKEHVKKTNKITDMSALATHIKSIDKEKVDKTKKLQPISAEINIEITEKGNFDEFNLEKYINMINIDQEVFYLGSSFLSLFLESIGSSLLFNKKKTKALPNIMETASFSSKNQSSCSLNVRFTNHYSNKNLTNLSKLSLDSLTTSNTNRTINKNKVLSLNSDSKFSLNSRNDFEEKGSIKSMFGINFPPFTIEKFKENSLTLKYQSQKYKFMRILMKSNNKKVEMDVGFIEFEVNEKKYIEIHKLYIIKVYRKMDIYEAILGNLFKNLFYADYSKNIQKIFIKVLDRFESYKALLGRLGFLLNEKMKIKEEYIAYMILKRKK